jgi:DNA repair ATPase RecN
MQADHQAKLKELGDLKGNGNNLKDELEELLEKLEDEESKVKKFKTLNREYEFQVDELME